MGKTGKIIVPRHVAFCLKCCRGSLIQKNLDNCQIITNLDAFFRGRSIPLTWKKIFANKKWCFATPLVVIQFSTSKFICLLRGRERPQPILRAWFLNNYIELINKINFYLYNNCILIKSTNCILCITKINKIKKKFGLQILILQYIHVLVSIICVGLYGAIITKKTTLADLWLKSFFSFLESWNGCF